MEYAVRVERNRLKFAAAHFATFEGGCEPLHGHNYAVSIEVAGTLTDDAWVLNFRTLKELGRAICNELDHKFLLQRQSRVLQIEERAASWHIRFDDREWIFPMTDVAVLPIDNTTAERLAEYILQRLRADLAAHGTANMTRITVGVEEAPGQMAFADSTS